MGETISNLNGNIVPLAGMLVGVVAILGGIAVVITKAIAAHRRTTKLDEMEASLKMEMIQQGMSAEDIKTVLEAKMGASRETSLDAPAHALATIMRGHDHG